MFLSLPDGFDVDMVERKLAATFLARDLVNTPPMTWGRSGWMRSLLRLPGIMVQALPVWWRGIAGAKLSADSHGWPRQRRSAALAGYALGRKGAKRSRWSARVSASIRAGSILSLQRRCC